MQQLLTIFLLFCALALPFVGALALRLVAPRLAEIHQYALGAAIFGLAIMAALLLARTHDGNLQVAGLSILISDAAQPTEMVLPPPPPTAVPDRVRSTQVPGTAATALSATATTVSVATPTPTEPAEAPTETLVPLPVTVEPPTPTSAPDATAAPTATAAPDATTAPTGTQKYTVQEGDALTSIAEKFGVSVRAILDANNLTEQQADSIRIGQELIIPK